MDQTGTTLLWRYSDYLLLQSDGLSDFPCSSSRRSPIGDRERAQELLKITRKGATEYEEESLGAVRFVPLIGEQGWAEFA